MIKNIKYLNIAGYPGTSTLKFGTQYERTCSSGQAARQAASEAADSAGLPRAMSVCRRGSSAAARRPRSDSAPRYDTSRCCSARQARHTAATPSSLTPVETRGTLASSNPEASDKLHATHVIIYPCNY